MKRFLARLYSVASLMRGRLFRGLSSGACNLAYICLKHTGWMADLVRVRFVIIQVPGRIGHEQGELDCFFREVEMGDQGGCGFKYALIVPKENISNEYALAQWRSRISVIRLPGSIWEAVVPILRKAQKTRWFGETDSYYVPLASSAKAYDVHKKWGGRPPLLEMEESDQERGWEILGKETGMNRRSWFVCIHCREEGYSTVDDSEHSYRNVSIDNYQPAMKLIADRGGVCFRMGDSSMKPLSPMDGVIDYANAPWKSEFMDVFLVGNCRFFLGCTSGLLMVALSHGKPCALADMTPFGMAALGPGDLFIPKLVRKKEGGILNFKDALTHVSSTFRFTSQFEEAKLEVIDNEPDEIEDLCLDMFDLLEGGKEGLVQGQERFSSLFEKKHYGFGHASRVAPSFLKRYSNLLAYDDLPRGAVS